MRSSGMPPGNPEARPAGGALVRL
ncbi:hypothetical protein LCGC14_1888620, partial [marine sediment metagenome]